MRRLGVFAAITFFAVLLAVAVPSVAAQQPAPDPMTVMAEGLADALGRITVMEKRQAALRVQQTADRFRTGAAISRITGVNDPDGFARSYAAKPREHGGALLTAAAEIRKRLDALEAARSGAAASAPAMSPSAAPITPAPTAAPVAASPPPVRPAAPPAPPAPGSRDQQVAAMLEQASGVLAGAARLMRGQ